MRRLLTLLVALAFIPSVGLARRGPAAPADVLLAANRTEPVVAVDPRRPSVVIAGANTNYDAPVNGTYPTAWFASGDGGRSFRANSVPLRSPYTTAADPTVAIAQDGTAFFSYLGETPAYCSSGHSAVMLAHSTDHGLSFRGPVKVDSNSADDKPNMAVESVAGRPSHVFLTWTRWFNRRSEIWLSRSASGGARFARPLRLHSSTSGNYGSVPVVAPHHRVYVFWSLFPLDNEDHVARTEILMRASTDDGVHFGPVRDISGPFGAIPAMTQPGSLRNLTMPAAVADSKGNLYVAFARATRRHPDGSVDANIVLTRSSDGGATWSRPSRVNDVTRGDRFMPAMTVWPDGSLGLAYYDRRNGWGQLDVYAVRVTDDGTVRTSANVRLNRSSSPITDIFYLKPGSTCFEPGRFFGDYIGVAAEPDGTLCAVWSDTQLHVRNQTDIWFTRARLPSAVRAR